MAMEAWGASDVGCVRTDNEDRVLIDASLGLFVVCDGMGGHQHGEIAAELAVSAVRFYIDSSRDRFDISWPFGYTFDISLDGNRLSTAIRLANRQVWRRAEQNLECSGMGTTIAAVLLNEGRAVIGNVGDSRVYLYRGSELSQISIDDTFVASMVSKGMITEPDAMAHPMRNVLTQAAGSQDLIDIHLSEEALQDADTFLICSDGLHSFVEDSVMRSILGGGDNPQRSVERLISAALTAGAPDNVSVILLRYSN